MGEPAPISVFHITKFLEYILELPELLLLNFHHSMMVIVAGFGVLYLAYRRRTTVCLLDFTCYQPPPYYRIPMSMFIEHNTLDNQVDEKSVAFQIKILAKSGFSEETSIPPSLAILPIKKSFTSTLDEVTTVMFSTVSDLLKKINIDPKAIDILITNCSLFCPSPSLSSMVVNEFRMRSNIMSFNISGMGCSAGIISISLAKDLLRVHGNSLAIIVSTEPLHTNWYTGKEPSMQLPNCLFRMGGAAILLSSRNKDRDKAKYELKHLVRTNNAREDQSFTCIFQGIDSEKKLGVAISKSTTKVAGDALKANMASLGPLVLPFTEQFRYGFSKICKKIGFLGSMGFYIPNFRRAFDHFCIHAGGRAIIQGMRKNLQLRDEDIEASKMTLYRFGNTSSSSLWYELSYIEAKGRMKRGNRVWQIALGSGFKCNSAVWKCIQNVDPELATVWKDEINSYPKEIPDTMKITPD